MPHYAYDIVAERGERAAMLDDECRKAFEESIDYAAIAKEWAAEICDSHSQVECRKEFLQVQLRGVLDAMYDLDGVAALGACLGANKSEDDFGAEWHASRREWTATRGFAG